MSDEVSPQATDEQAESLAAFLAQHVKPYYPDTDDYDRPPFASDIKEGKNDPIYNAHSYHTKVPPRSIIPYILHYTQPGDVVLDPFCGSGMTGVAAQMCANPPADILGQFSELKDRVGPRACILNDLSPAACHIAYNYNTPVDVDAVRREFERIKETVKDEFVWLYGTEHYEPAVGLYDPSNPEVASRLKNPPDAATVGQSALFEDEERTWELISKADVEERLGYSVAALPRDDKLDDLDVTTVDRWINIPATIRYTIWSDVYRCEGLVTIEEPTGKMSTRGKNAGKPIMRKRRVARGCGNRIVLWEAAVTQNTGEVSETFACPHCQDSWKKIQATREPAIPVKSNIEYTGLQSRKGKTRLAILSSIRPVSKREIELIERVSDMRLDLWVPTVRFDKRGPQYRRNALSARHIDYVTDLFTKRNLRGLSLLWNAIAATQDKRLRRAFEFVFTAIITRSSWLNRRRPSGAGDPQTGTIYISSLTREDNVLRLFERRFTRQLPLVEFIRTVPCKVLNRSACSLPEIPDASIDYVFTDPPFGSNIYYSEPNLIWEAWLGQVTDATEEAVVHRKNDGGTKRLPDYARLMGAAFAEIFRVLKPGRWATVEFNNSDGAVFEAIKEAIRKAGFDIVNMLLLDKKQKTFKQVKGAEGVEDVVDKDVLFNLHKPAAIRTDVCAENHDLEHQVADAVREHLQTLPERIKADPGKYSDEHRTTATINSMVMNTLIPRGVSVGRLNLPFIERVCARYFRKVGQYWYLRGQAVGNGVDQEGLFEEEVQIRDEVTAIEWLRQKLHAAPMLIGELKPLWMRATGLLPAAASETLSLEGLLAENVWRDRDKNRWREPTDEERERMNDDRSIRVLHDAERYVAGSLRCQTTDSERCNWINVLFKACREIEDGDAQSTPALRGFDCGEGYRLVARLFQTILKEKVLPTDFARAQKQAAAASKRIGHEVREEKQRSRADASKKRGPTLFDMDDVT